LAEVNWRLKYRVPTSTVNILRIRVPRDFAKDFVKKILNVAEAEVKRQLTLLSVQKTNEPSSDLFVFFVMYLVYTSQKTCILKFRFYEIAKKVCIFCDCRKITYFVLDKSM